MAGHKKSKGPKVQHRKYFYRGVQHKPALCVCSKVMGRGYKKIMGASSIEDGKIILNQNGRPMPWQHIQWD